MEPLSASNMESEIAEAWVTDMATGMRTKLSTRSNSRCHFFDPFDLGSYEVRLRLDWGDIDSNGHPRLDADFVASATGDVDKSMRLHPAHHTESQSGTARTYAWQYADESREFKVEVTWLCSASLRSSGSLRASGTVIRKTDT